MPLTLYFLRHGQTALSREDMFCGSGVDPELTPEGMEMADAFVEHYRETEWSAVYSSCLRRSISTAQPLEIDLQMRAELNEIGYGKWEGQTKEKVNEEFHDDYIRWLADPAWHAPTEGESAILIAQRGLKVMDEIQKRFTNGNILIVSHKATIRIILCSLLGIDVGRFRYRLACPVGSVSVVEFTRDGPLLKTLADRSHLPARLRSLRGT